MPARDASLLVKDYSAHLRFTEATRRRVELLFRKDRLYRKDVELVYAGLYLDSVTGLERLIENLFVGLLCGKVSHRLASVRAKAVVPSYPAAWDIVLSGKNFVDWLPYSRTEERAEAFFRMGQPFTRLEKSDRSRLDRIMALRNVIAHKSPHSQRVFERTVLGDLDLTARERTPTGFLRSAYMSSPVRLRYEEFTMDMQLVAAKLR